MPRVLKYQGLAIGWALFILIICNMSVSGIPSSPIFFAGFDKLVHTGLFFVLTVLVFFGLIRQYGDSALSIGRVIAAIVLLILFGGAIEVLQWKVFTYRSGDWADLFADSLGTFMGAFSVLVTAYACRYEKK